MPTLLGWPISVSLKSPYYCPTPLSLCRQTQFGGHSLTILPDMRGFLLDTQHKLVSEAIVPEDITQRH